MIIFQRIGKEVIEIFNFLTRVAAFFLIFLSKTFTSRFYFKRSLGALFEITFLSLPIVALTSLFTGSVLVLQSYSHLVKINVDHSIASVLVISIARELGPVLVGLMLTAKITGSIAAEIGSMKITEQIDALYTLRVHPISYLMVPKMVAGIISFPVLGIIADVLGILGGYIVATYTIGFDSDMFLSLIVKYLKYTDVVYGLMKTLIFGFIVIFSGCYYGFYVFGGASGVGQSSTKAVVLSSILILIVNYFVTQILFKIS